VASVLPPRMPAESIAPRAAQPWVERVEPSGWPFLVLLIPALLVIAAAALWWRRRGRIAPAIATTSNPGNVRDRLERWRASGESALVIDHLLGALPDEPATQAWRAEVDAIRFDPSARSRLDQLAADGLRLFDAARVAR